MKNFFDNDDVRFVMVTLALSILAPFCLISSFVFSVKFYSLMFNIPCEVCGEVRK